MKATVDGQVVAESGDVIEADGYYYFPPEAVRLDLLEKVPKTEKDHACPHGVQFYDVVVKGVRHRRAAWSYEWPRRKLQAVANRFGFWQEVKVE